MKQAIWKFPLKVEAEQFIEAPAALIPLALQAQGDIPCLWALVSPDAPKTKLRIIMRGTGWVDDDRELDLALKYRHLGTVQLGGFVWHYFW